MNFLEDQNVHVLEPFWYHSCQEGQNVCNCHQFEISASRGSLHVRVTHDENDEKVANNSYCKDARTKVDPQNLCQIPGLLLSYMRRFWRQKMVVSGSIAGLDEGS